MEALPSPGSVKPERGRYDGEAPRRHQRVEPWPDLMLSPKERAVQATHLPVHVLVQVLAYDDFFLDAIERVRSGSESPEQVARRYVRRASRPRAVMCQVVRRAASRTASCPRFQVLSVAMVLVDVDAPLSADDPAQWPHAKRWPKAAAMLARLGSRRCLDPRCSTPLASDGPCRRYCAAHEGDAVRERRDQDAIVALLDGVGRTLGV